jgi:hypothetical protein
VTGEKRLAEELLVLRRLCDETVDREERVQLMDSVCRDFFVAPEHAIIFESIRSLLPLGPLSEARLRVHLTRRGFPDTDVEKYFQS